MINEKTITAIILTAGNSQRFKKGTNKNFEILKGKTVLAYSLLAFEKNKYIDSIIIAAKENDLPIIKDIISNENLNKPTKIIIGGNSRKQSVYNCINAIKSDIVIIHDGARPLIKQEYITECVKNSLKFKGITTGVKAKDTIKISDSNNIVINTTNRNNTWLIQTPQCFDRVTLLNAHIKHSNEDATDDCFLLEKEGCEIKIINGDYSNIKITTIEDLYIVEKILSNSNFREQKQAKFTPPAK